MPWHKHFIAVFVELVLAVNGRGGQNQVDSGSFSGRGQCSGCSIDILGDASGQSGNPAGGGFPGNRFYGVEISRGDDGKAGFDDINAQVFQLMGDPDFLFHGHAGSRALFSVAQRGVENIYTRGLN